MVKIYCLNLERSKDRRTLMEQRFSEQNLEVEFFTGVDAKAMDITEEHMKGRTCVGEYGCLASHFKIWEDIVAKGHDKAVILEDDMDLVPEFKNKIDDLNLPEKWDVIYLYKVSPIFEGEENEDLNRGRSLSTATYMVSLDGAKKLTQLDHMDYRGNVDAQMAQIPLKTFWSKEEFTTHDGFIYSTISFDPQRIPIYHNSVYFEQKFGVILAFILLVCLLFYLKTRLLK